MASSSPGAAHWLPNSWLRSDRPLARLVGRPVQKFLAVEAAGGILLVGATVVALIWANSPWSASYDSFFHTHIRVSIGSWSFDESAVHVINDALMALFFFVVGLEIKREWVAGELQDRRAAMLPAIAALGGMVVPALIYTAFNLGGPGEAGWGIPMATDIAFALGVVAVLGSRVPTPLKVFLLTLAIVDDIGAIVVIAIFYSDGLSWGWLAVAGAIVLLVLGGRRAGIRYHLIYVVLGMALWLAVYESGVHATIAGVVMGLLTPAVPFLPELEADRIVDQLENRPELSATEVHRVSVLVSESVPLTERLEELLHPYTSYLIVPLFALANAGIALSGDSLGEHRRVLVGVVAGLLVGKTVGISAFSWVAVRIGVGTLPDGVRFSQLVGAAMLAGIGFTVSLFVTGLAFEEGPTAGPAKIGILVASVLAACGGSAVLAATGRRGSSPDETASDPG